MSITSIRCPGYFVSGTDAAATTRRRAIEDPDKWEPATITEVAGTTRVRCGSCINGTCTASIGKIKDSIEEEKKFDRARQMKCVHQDQDA